jgi:hypothetical protein
MTGKPARRIVATGKTTKKKVTGYTKKEVVKKIEKYHSKPPEEWDLTEEKVINPKKK